MARAQRKFDQGNWAAAREWIERAMGRAPAWAEPHFALALVLRQQGAPRFEEEASLLAALERDPQHRMAEAELLAIRAWRHEPLTQAWHLYYGKRYGEALEAFRAALLAVGTRLPESERGACLAGMGWSHRGYGRSDWGLQAFQEALEVNPGLAHAHYGKGLCLYTLGAFVEAEHALHAALEIEPRLLDAANFIAWSRYALGQMERALEVFGEVITKREGSAEAQWGRAWCAWRLERIDLAAHSFARALELNPHHPSRTDFDNLVAVDARFAPLAAIPTAQAPMQSNTRHKAAPGWFIDGMEALVKGDADRAIERITTEAVQGPDAWRQQVLLGRAFEIAGDLERAENAWRRAHETAPMRPEPIERLANCLRAQGKVQEGEQLLREALEQQPNNHVLGQALLEYLKACELQDKTKEQAKKVKASLEEALAQSRRSA
ncbi:MAG: tetratricopeptide repeat protein [Planctomycetes bacterium]|nr:tetratricopeptide repeat protein [Planctomycetota bacterium]